jgi:hypothetical protein
VSQGPQLEQDIASIASTQLQLLLQQFKVIILISSYWVVEQAVGAVGQAMEVRVGKVERLYQ